MIKFHLYYDKDAETKWLNKLCADGWAMKKFFAGFYWFEKCEKGEYNYQVDFGDKPFSVNDNYRELMNDIGVEIVQTWGYWIILRKPASYGAFELYTDIDSSINHYTKIRNMFKTVTIIELIGLFIELYAAMQGSTTGCISTCIFLVIVFTFLNAINKTNSIIISLKEKKGEIVSNKRKKNISFSLLFGLILNSFALIINTSISSPVTHIIQIIAIIFMLIGIYKTFNNCNN